MRKEYNRNIVKEAISKLNGLNVLAYFIIGFPGDTEAKVHETVDFTEKSQLKMVSIRPLYVSSDFYERACLNPEMFCHLKGDFLDTWNQDTMNYTQTRELAK